MKIQRKLLDASGRHMTAEELLQIEVKPGWKKGTKITFPEKGDEHPNRIPADIVFRIDEKPHDRFTREGNDLLYTQRISLTSALTGVHFPLQHLDGRTLNVEVDQVINPKFVKVIKGEGMPISKQPGAKGDLHIHFDIQFPTSITTQQAAQLRQILGK